MSAVCSLYKQATNFPPYQSYISNVAGIESLQQTEPAQFYHLHELKAMCHIIYPNEWWDIVSVDTFLFTSDVNLAFRDVSRVHAPCTLLVAKSYIVPAHSADCDILPGELAKVDVIIRPKIEAITAAPTSSPCCGCMLVTALFNA